VAAGDSWTMGCEDGESDRVGVATGVAAGVMVGLMSSMIWILLLKDGMLIIDY
jgi:hypothetical protein